MPSRPVPTTPLLPQVAQQERQLVRWAGDLTRALFLVLGDLARAVNDKADAADLTAFQNEFTGTYPGSFYEENSFIPVLTCSTPGDLNVAYSEQIAEYTRIGRIAVISVRIVGTVTYTTASGALLINGSPLVSSFGANFATGSMNNFTGMPLTAGRTWLEPILASNGQSHAFRQFDPSGVGNAISITNISSGSLVNITYTLTVQL